MSPRPKSDKSKHNRFELRLDDEMSEMLNECSKKMNTTKTEVINKGIRMVKSELDKNKQVANYQSNKPVYNPQHTEVVDIFIL